MDPAQGSTVIRNWRHKGLKKYFQTGSKQGIQPEHEEPIRKILHRLNASQSLKDMNLPGLDFHELKGDRKGTYSVSVRGNWKITFRFENGDSGDSGDSGDVIDVDYEDYH